MILDCLNPNLPSPVVGLLGIHGDLLYLSLLFAGNCLLRKEEQIRIFGHFALIPIIVASGISIYQHAVDPYFLNRKVLEVPELRTIYMRPIPGFSENMIMAPSLFVDPGRYARYALFVFWFSLTIAPLIGVWSLIYITAAILGMITAGPRFAPVITVSALLLIMSLRFFSWIKEGVQGTRIKRIASRFAIGGLLAIGISTFILYLALPNVIERSTLWFKNTLIGSEERPSDISIRIPGYLRAFRSFWVLEGGIFGLGTGSNSLGGQYLEKFLKIRTHFITEGSEQGFRRYLLMYGLLGFIIRFLLFLVILRVIWNSSEAFNEERGKWVVKIWFCFLISYLTLAQLLGAAHMQDYMAQSFLWLVSGLVISLPKVYGNEKTEIEIS